MITKNSWRTAYWMMVSISGAIILKLILSKNDLLLENGKLKSENKTLRESSTRLDKEKNQMSNQATLEMAMRKECQRTK